MISVIGKVLSITVTGGPVGPTSAEVVVDLLVDDTPTALRIGAAHAPQVFAAMMTVLSLAVSLQKAVTVAYEPTTETPSISQIYLAL